MPYSLKCPACRTKFPWNPVEGFPDFCPNPKCETRIAHDRADDDVVMPFIRSNGHTRATDDVYRQMEVGSQVRAQAAADVAGVPVSEMSDLKITDLRPTTRQGDIAAPPLPPHLQNVGSFGGTNGAQGAQFSGAVQTGPFPNAGARAQTLLRQAHAERVGWDKVGDRPANEMFMPGYRPRA